MSVPAVRLEQVPAILERERIDLATISDPKEMVQTERRLAAITELTRRGNLSAPIQNEANLLRMRAQERVAVLVREGQERGEIATQEAGRPKSPKSGGIRPKTLGELGVKSQRLSEGELLLETNILDEVEAEVQETRAKKPADEKVVPTDRVLRRARDKRAAKKKTQAAAAAATLPPTDGVDLHVCSALDMIDQLDESVIDLVFTDPPYPREHLSSWSELAELSAYALKPTGILAAYSGQFYLPEVMGLLGEHLQYVWTGCLYTPGGNLSPRQKPLQTSWKPVVLFMRRDGKPSKFQPRFHDVVVSDEKGRVPDERERIDHEWQQAVVPTIEWIRRLSAEHSLVLDPFLGSGTTAVAARALPNRAFIGCDISESSVQTTRARLAS